MSSRLPPSCAAPEAGIHEHWAEVDGHRMRYLHGGSGPPLLLVHGLLGYSFSWRFNLPVLARRFTVFAPDLLGTSHGGAIAMRLAIMAAERAPGSVRRLILVDPAHPWSRPRPVLIRLLAHPAGAALFRALLPAIKLTHEHYLRRMYGDPRRISPGTAEGYAEPLVNRGAYQYPLCIVRSWHADMGKLQEMLPKIADLPTLLIWGSRDRVIAPHSAAQLQRQFRNCRLLVVEGAGHLPYEEMPEEFNRAVLEFLEDQ